MLGGRWDCVVREFMSKVGEKIENNAPTPNAQTKIAFGSSRISESNSGRSFIHFWRYSRKPVRPADAANASAFISNACRVICPSVELVNASSSTRKGASKLAFRYLR